VSQYLQEQANDRVDRSTCNERRTDDYCRATRYQFAIHESPSSPETEFLPAFVSTRSSRVSTNPMEFSFPMGQLPALGQDVLEGTTQVKSSLNAKVMERIVLVGHFC
jgi:hypothetical protein